MIADTESIGAMIDICEREYVKWKNDLTNINPFCLDNLSEEESELFIMYADDAESLTKAAATCSVLTNIFKENQK